VSPVRYELDVYNPEDGILHSSDAFLVTLPPGGAVITSVGQNPNCLLKYNLNL
jgi:hypothetical protein